MGLKVFPDKGLYDILSPAGDVKNATYGMSWSGPDGILKSFIGTARGVEKKYREDRVGGNRTALLENRLSAEGIRMNLHFDLTDGDGAFTMYAEVFNEGTAPIDLAKVCLFDLSLANGGFADVAASLMYNFFGLPIAFMPFGPYFMNHEVYTHNKTEFTGCNLSVLHNPSSGSYLLTGFLDMKDYFGYHRLKLQESTLKLKNYQIDLNLDGIPLPPGGRFVTPRLSVELGSDITSGMIKYTRKLKESMNVSLASPALTGWSSWDYYHRDINEDVLIENLKHLAKKRRELPVEYFQIDHGFINCEGDWLEWDKKKFPHGPRWMAEKIKEYGFKPGIWLVPFNVSSESKLYRDHPEWMIKDAAGVPLPAASYTTKKVYLLDGSVPEAREWVKGLFAQCRDCGFDYVKIDGAVMHSLSDGCLQDPAMTKVQAYRKVMEAAREGGGPGMVIMGGVLGPGIGVVDGMRIGPDMGARWDWSKIDVHRGERDNYPGPGYMKGGVVNTLNSWFMNGELWWNDPDYLVVRKAGDHSMLTLDEALTWASIVSLSNGYVVLGDRIKTLTKDRIAIMQKLFPLYGKTAIPADFMQHDVPSTLNLTAGNNSEQWHVVFAFNIFDRPMKKELNFAALGLDPDKAYHAFDFWNTKYLGTFKGSLNLGELRPHACRVLSLREDTGKPQVVGTDTHITMGAVEIESTTLKNGKFAIKTTGACPRKGKIFIKVPGKKNLKVIKTDFGKKKEIVI